MFFIKRVDRGVATQFTFLLKFLSGNGMLSSKQNIHMFSWSLPMHINVVCSDNQVNIDNSYVCSYVTELLRIWEFIDSFNCDQLQNQSWMPHRTGEDETYVIFLYYHSKSR